MIFDKRIADKMKIEHNKRLTTMTDIANYYRGNTDVIRNYPKNENRCNRKVNSNFIKAFTDEEVSFMVGQPITYVDKGKQGKKVIKDIEYYINNAKSTIDIESATNLALFGTAYELYYKNNNEFKIKTFTPLEAYAYCDVEGNVLLFMYYYKKELDDNTYIQFIDSTFIYDMDENFNILSKPIPHYFDCCPVGVAKLPNGVNDTLYNSIKSLQDAYENCLSDWGNEIGDTRLAYLVLTGVELEEEQAKNMKKMGIMQIPDASGKAQYLVKAIPSDFIKQYRDTLKEDIYRVSQHIDNQTQIQSNTSGSMLSVRMNCLRLKIMTQNQALKNCIKTRLKCLFRYLDLNMNKSYDYKLIDIRPQLNLPKNDVEIAQIITQLNGKLSAATGLNQLSFVTNGEEEYQKYLDEQKKQLEINPVSLDNLPLEGAKDGKLE